jgi:hypothetical protein
MSGLFAVPYAAIHRSEGNMGFLLELSYYHSLTRMCGDRYFQIFDDLLLALDTLQYCEPENTGECSGGQ